MPYIYVYFGFQFNNHKLNDAFYVNSCKKCSSKGKATVAPIAQKRCLALPEQLRTKSSFLSIKSTDRFRASAGVKFTIMTVHDLTKFSLTEKISNHSNYRVLCIRFTPTLSVWLFCGLTLLKSNDEELYFWISCMIFRYYP